MLGIIGSGSWATALAKILTDGNQHINWWVRNAETRDYIQNRRHNPHYLSSVYFDTSLLSLENDLSKVIADSDIIIIAVPSAFIEETLSGLNTNCFENKKINFWVKGNIPWQECFFKSVFVKQIRCFA